jgi:RNA methyltransferase, TrmH family
MNDNHNVTNKQPTIYYTQKKNESVDHAKRSSVKTAKKTFAERKHKDNRKSSEKSHFGQRSSRIETFNPRKDVTANRGITTKKDNVNGSPWQNKKYDKPQKAIYHQDDNSNMNFASLKKQRQNEVYVYSENSCWSVFKQRPTSIIKAFLTQATTTKFRDLVMWLAEQRLGYDIVTDEQMEKLCGTPHHGGICLIVKKRQVSLAIDYLSQHQSLTNDCILAVDDINNPHNLGALIRSAAFFAVNGIILRQPDGLEIGSALRIAEGGGEYIKPIKADDMVITLNQFKQAGYQIVTLLPCKMKAFPAESLFDVQFSPKTVFVLFQQVNKSLINIADKVIYLPGSEFMTSLNISVATGILLAKYRM